MTRAAKREVAVRHETVEAWAWAEYVQHEAKWALMFRYLEDVAERERLFDAKCGFTVGPLTRIEIPLPRRGKEKR